MRFHLFKQSRVYSGRPYCGPTSGGFPAESDSLIKAINLAKYFNTFNPVGWDVFDSETGNLVWPNKGD